MIQRTANPALVEKLSGIDLSEALAEPLHVCLYENRSGAIFMWRGPGIYEAHIFFAARGREAFDLAKGLLEKMRAEYGARMFWALVPEADRKVKMFVRFLGWKSHGVKETRHGPNELFVQESA